MGSPGLFTNPHIPIPRLLRLSPSPWHAEWTATCLGGVDSRVGTTGKRLCIGAVESTRLRHANARVKGTGLLVESRGGVSLFLLLAIEQ